MFAFKINYNNTPAITGGKALYNGNIAETFWSSTSDVTPIVRGYAYLYDNLNRLKTSVYKRDAVISNAYSENLAYDKNGNINSIIRNGNSETATQIDALVYTYAGTNTTNQLVKVVDNAPAASKVFGFTDSAANTVDDYSYDFNGNMTKDNNKNITAITYNHLNLPTKITFATTGNIVYIYNAAGQKVQKIVNEVGKSVVTTDYLGGYQYDNNLLKFFPTAEGYVEPSGSSYKYVYQYKDHLGNVRLSYDKTLVIKEESNFYPFGLKQEGYNTLKIGVENKYKYNGKELQDELSLNLYDYGFRNYDPAIGRWMNIDPLAEKGRRWSPYNYAYNNPVYFVDPDGMESQGYMYDKNQLAELQEENKKFVHWVNSGGNKNKEIDPPTKKTREAEQEKWRKYNEEKLIPLNKFLIAFALVARFWETGVEGLYMRTGTTAELAPLVVNSEANATKTATIEEGSFSVIDWEGYPVGGVKPTGPFRLIEGQEYTTARNSANVKNAAIRRADPEALKGLQIHEIQPVKFGGNPTDLLNKTYLTPQQHSAYTNYWNGLMRNIKK